MSLFVLDTDHVSLWFRGHSSICAQAAHLVTILEEPMLLNLPKK